MKQLRQYEWLCREIEEALELSGTQETAEEVAAYRARLADLTRRAQHHLQDSIACMKAIEAEMD